MLLPECFPVMICGHRNSQMMGMVRNLQVGYARYTDVCARGCVRACMCVCVYVCLFFPSCVLAVIHVGMNGLGK